MAEAAALIPTGPGPRPVVLYIAGSGRSGSTLLERTIAAIPGFTTAGELIDLFRRDALGERCGCGQPLLQCPLWTAVGERALGSFDPSLLEEMSRLQQQVARQRHLPKLLSPVRGRAFEARLVRYGAVYAEVYRAVAQEAGARVVVDASKWPAQALALSLGGVDMRVVHLVRDVLGVAYSLAKQDIQRTAALGGTEAMFSEPAPISAARWLATQSEVDLLQARGIPVARVRYGDFVEAPAAAVARVLRELEVAVPAGGLDHIEGRSITLGPSHGLSGNPSRFRHGATVLRSDDAWRQKMPRRDRLAVQLIALPQVLRFAAGTSAAVASSQRSAQEPAQRRAQERAQERAQVQAEPHAQVRAQSWPLVSAVVATHGRPELVREALESVVAQSYPGEMEIIVVHDREPVDPALVELGRPGRTIQLVTNTHSGGLAGARNTALDLAKGDFVATCDDDDSWHPTKVEKQVQRLLDEPDLLMVGAGIRLRLPGGKVAEWPGRADRIPYDLLLRNRVKELHSSTLLMRRDVFAKAGRYDEELPNGYAEDWDFILRVARVGRVGVVREPLADIRKDVPSYYRGKAQGTAVALEHFLAKHPDIAGSRRGNARITGQMAFARSVLGERDVALRYATTSLLSWPLSPHPYVAFAHLATGVDPSRVQKAARLLGRGMA
jgi:hypothetical protein